MNKILVSLIALVVAVMALPGNALALDYGKQKVVYHINYDDAKRQMGALRNIQNHINAVGAENMEIKVVMHGNGLGLLVNAMENQDLRARVDELKMQNVGFQICNNTVVGRKYDLANDLYDAKESDIIPSGVAHLSYLQAQGYTYIKP